MNAIRPAILHYRQTKTDNTGTEEIEHWNTSCATHNNQWRSFDFFVYVFYRCYFVNVL